jgi:hypothetical protein
MTAQMLQWNIMGLIPERPDAQGLFINRPIVPPYSLMFSLWEGGKKACVSPTALLKARINLG